MSLDKFHLTKKGDEWRLEKSRYQSGESQCADEG